MVGGEERNRPTGEGMEESKQIKEDFIRPRLSECPLADLQLRRIRVRGIQHQVLCNSLVL